MSNPRSVYFINQLKRTPDSTGFIPCIAKEGEKGFYATDWEWNDCTLKEAEEMVAEMNEKMGYTSEEAMKIQLSTM